MGLLTILHIFVAVILILLVLVQDSKGAMGSAFGGGRSNTLFGATGADNVLTKTTKGVVVLFALTCILLTRLSAEKSESVLDEVGAVEQVHDSLPTDTTQGDATE